MLLATNYLTMRGLAAYRLTEYFDKAALTQPLGVSNKNEALSKILIRHKLVSYVVAGLAFDVGTDITAVSG